MNQTEPTVPTSTVSTNNVSTRAGQRPQLTRWGLALILFLAFVLRTWNLDWDRGTHLQPDERFWSDVAAHVERPADWSWNVVLDPEVSPLNPRVHKPNYVYGTLPLWASEAAAAVLMTDSMGWAVSALDGFGIDLAHDDPGGVPVGERLRFNTGYEVTLVGRLMSALIDTATVAVVYLLGSELADHRTGLLAAFLQALTVLHIQYTHFLGSEPWVAFFVAVTVWGSVRLARGRGGWKERVITGAALGCAIGSKLSGIAAAAAPAVAALVVVAPQLWSLVTGRVRWSTLDLLARRVEPWIVTALIAVVAYRAVQPYDFNAGLSLVFNDRFQADIGYLKDINTGGNWPWVQPLVGATPLLHPLKQMFLWGMGPGLGSAAGFGVGLAAWRFRKGERFWAVPLSVVGAYFLLVSFQFYAIIRYLQPTYPIMTALAAVGLVSAWRWAAATAPAWPRVATWARVGVVAAVGITVFWAAAFVNGVYGQDNARLAAGDWMIDNLDPASVVSQQAWDDGLPWGRPSEFGRVTLEPFSFGGDTPDHIERLLTGLDQVDYVIETSNKFYDALPRTPARFPQMTEYYRMLFDGSLGFDLVREFSNRPSLFGLTIDDSSAEEAFTLYDHPTVFIWKKTARFDVDRAREMLNPDRARTALNAIPRDAGTNAGMLRPGAYATQQSGSSYSDVHGSNPNSFVAMLQWLVVIEIAALAVAPWMLAMSGRAGSTVWGFTKLVGLLVFAVPIWLVVSWGLVSFSGPLIWAALLTLVGFGVAGFALQMDRLEQIWIEHRRALVAAELVFVGVFVVVVALRAANPDLWHPWRGGEKPMELAYFTAVTGSTTFPPYDPWLAGGSLNYYYFGWFLLAVPTRLLGLQPDVAFNLGVATYAAFAAVTIFSTAAMTSRLVAMSAGRRLPSIRAGLLATLLFVGIGNLDGFRQLITRLGDGLALSEFDWWDPSRVNKKSPGSEVTEFPNFTVLFADLHPHFMAMGLFGLGIAGAAAFIDWTRRGSVMTSWVMAVGLGFGSAIIGMVHTWDLPTFALVGIGAIVIGWSAAAGPVAWRVRSALGQLVVATLVHVVVTAPYRAHNLVTETGFHRAESSTNLDDFVVHWGLFLFVAVTWSVARLVKRRAAISRSLLRTGSMAIVSLVGFVILHARVGSVAAWVWLLLVASIAGLAFEVQERRGATGAVMVGACFTLGFAVLLMVELFTQNADIARLNTVFKFWLQVWHLFAFASAVAVVLIIDAIGRSQAVGGLRPALARRLFGGGLVLLIVASLVYPVLAVRPRSSYRIDTTTGPSLEGHLWLDPGVTQFGIRDAFDMDYTIDPGHDAAVIEWLRNNVEGRPTIVEAVGGSEYQWWGRISINTGLPTVLGWRWHQSQQRTIFSYEVNERKADVAAFFTSTSAEEISSFLRAYDVSYVVIGTIESAIMSYETRDLLATNRSLLEVFRDGDRVIYEVAKRSLAQSRGPIASMGSG